MKYEFTTKNNVEFKFDSYLDFAEWYFSIPRRVMQSLFDEATFRIMERKATSSAAARKRMA